MYVRTRAAGGVAQVLEAIKHHCSCALRERVKRDVVSSDCGVCPAGRRGELHWVVLRVYVVPPHMYVFELLREIKQRYRRVCAAAFVTGKLLVSPSSSVCVAGRLP